MFIGPPVLRERTTPLRRGMKSWRAKWKKKRRTLKRWFFHVSLSPTSAGLVKQLKCVCLDFFWVCEEISDFTFIRFLPRDLFSSKNLMESDRQLNPFLLSPWSVIMWVLKSHMMNLGVNMVWILSHDVQFNSIKFKMWIFCKTLAHPALRYWYCSLERPSQAL